MPDDTKPTALHDPGEEASSQEVSSAPVARAAPAISREAEQAPDAVVDIIPCPVEPERVEYAASHQSSSRHKSDGLHYQLPPVVESLRAGWQAKIQAGGVISALLAAIAAQLLTSSDRSRQTSSARAFRILGYTSIFLSVSAVILGALLMHLLAGLAYKSANRRTYRDEPLTGSQSDLLVTYGAGSWWKRLELQWRIGTYGGAYVLMFMFMSYLGDQEKKPVRQIALAFGFICGMVAFVSCAAIVNKKGER